MWIMKICILGCGLQGRVVAQDLNKNKHEVTILDSRKENLRKVDKSLNIKTKIFDVTSRAELIRFIKNFDVVVGALPARLGFYSMRCAIEAGVDQVDLSYSGEDPFLLDRDAKKKKIKIVPDAGFAPGLSNILIGEIYRLWGKVDYLRILVGGMPINPIPPFNYRCTWSPADLIEEYTRPSRIIRNSKIVTVETLSSIEGFSTPQIGYLECFYTDGLRTLLKTIKPVKNMEEKTIRYAGHAELLKSLIEYGFQPDSENPFTNPKIKPNRDILDFLNKQLNPASVHGSGTSQYDDKDLSILIVEIKKGKRTMEYTCIDYYDEKNKITSMARMTAYTGSIITQCIKDYPGFGVIAPEYLGTNKDICNFIKTELKRRNITIKSNNTLRAT